MPALHAFYKSGLYTLNASLVQSSCRIKKLLQIMLVSLTLKFRGPSHHKGTRWGHFAFAAIPTVLRSVNFNYNYF